MPASPTSDVPLPEEVEKACAEIGEVRAPRYLDYAALARALLAECRRMIRGDSATREGFREEVLAECERRYERNLWRPLPTPPRAKP